jgi:ClpP class serine protease
MQYPLILSRLLNTPLLLEGSKLDIITNNVSMKLVAGETVEKLDSGSEISTTYVGNSFFGVQNGISIIPVHGTLVSHNAAGDSGVRSYMSISNEIRYSLEKKVSTIILSIKSYGGEASGNFGLCSYIYSLRNKGVRTIALIDGPACSAGYTLASSCQEIWVTPSSEVGSIGVLATLVDLSQKDKKDGVEFKVIRSKDEKALASAHEGFNEKLLKSVTDKVMELDTEMNLLVSKNRSVLSIESIKELKGRTVLGREAINLGLADKLIESFDIALEDLASSSTKTSVNNLRTVSMNLEEENVSLKEEISGLKADSKVQVVNAIKSERDRVIKIMEAGKTFGLSNDIVQKRISAGTSYEDTVEMFEGIKEAIQMNNPSPKVPASERTASENIEGSNKEPNCFEQFIKISEAAGSETFNF